MANIPMEIKIYRVITAIKKIQDKEGREVCQRELLSGGKERPLSIGVI